MTDATGSSPLIASSDALTDDDVATEYAEARARFFEAARKANMPMPNLPPPPEPAPDDGPALPSVGDVADLTRPPGLVGALVDWMEASAERPKRALYLAPALTFVATLAGRKFASPTDLRSNLYCVTLAQSGHGKDHAIGKIALLASTAGLDRYVGPARIMSASALRALIKREPAVACYMDEFAGLMRQIHDRRAGLHNQMIKHDLLDLFSRANSVFAGAEYAGEAATKIPAPNLSISGTSTPDDFWSALTSLSTMDGLLARIILLNVDGPKAPRRSPEIGPREVPAPLIKACRELAEAGGRANLGGVHGTAPEPVVVHFDAEALAALEQFTAETDAAEEGGESPLTRVREHAIKLALTVAVGVNPAAPVITGPIFEWASRLAMLSAVTLIREARDRIADNEREASYNRILLLIRKAGNAGITEGTIRDRCRGIDERMRKQILDDLQISGRVRKMTASTGKAGRPAERLIAT
ncbi:MAG: DUF3987 domain-containing protein [Sphingomicrobium sp.]